MKHPKKDIKIVVVEDDKYYNKALVKYVETICSTSVYPQFNFEIQSFFNAHDCIEQMADDVNIMILDYFLINEEEKDVLTAADIMNEVRAVNPDCKVIVVSSQQSPQITSELMKKGIYEYIDKNVSSKNRLGAVIEKLLLERSVL